MSKPIVIMSAEEVATHVHDHTYKWSKGARCGEWLVLIGPDSNRKPPFMKPNATVEYGYKEFGGEDRGGLWFVDGALVDEDGCYDSHVGDRDDNGTVKLKTVGRMLEALGMDAKSYLA